MRWRSLLRQREKQERRTKKPKKVVKAIPLALSTARHIGRNASCTLRQACRG
jgi:hypothetical protein